MRDVSRDRADLKRDEMVHQQQSLREEMKHYRMLLADPRSAFIVRNLNLIDAMPFKTACLLMLIVILFYGQDQHWAITGPSLCRRYPLIVPSLSQAARTAPIVNIPELVPLRGL